MSYEKPNDPKKPNEKYQQNQQKPRDQNQPGQKSGYQKPMDKDKETRK